MKHHKSGAAEAVVHEVAESDDQARFELELAARFPERLIKRFAFPSNVKQARAVYMMEITSRDEVQASIYADALMSDLERRSLKLAAEAERRECVRASIVGLVRRTEPATYEHTGKAGAFHEIDGWPAKATACLQTFFGDLNGVPTSELLEGLKGARTIGASEPPKTPGIPASASTAK